jgi:hypothetical protein
MGGIYHCSLSEWLGELHRGVGWLEAAHESLSSLWDEDRQRDDHAVRQFLGNTVAGLNAVV